MSLLLYIETSCEQTSCDQHSTANTCVGILGDMLDALIVGHPEEQSTNHVTRFITQVKTFVAIVCRIRVNLRVLYMYRIMF